MYVYIYIYICVCVYIYLFELICTKESLVGISKVSRGHNASTQAASSHGSNGFSSYSRHHEPMEPCPNTLAHPLQA